MQLPQQYNTSQAMNSSTMNGFIQTPFHDHTAFVQIGNTYPLAGTDMNHQQAFQPLINHHHLRQQQGGYIPIIQNDTTTGLCPTTINNEHIQEQIIMQKTKLEEIEIFKQIDEVCTKMVHKTKGKAFDATNNATRMESSLTSLMPKREDQSSSPSSPKIKVTPMIINNVPPQYVATSTPQQGIQSPPPPLFTTSPTSSNQSSKNDNQLSQNKRDFVQQLLNKRKRSTSDPSGGNKRAKTNNSSGVGSNKNGKKQKHFLPQHAVQYLKEWFYEHLDHPYPSADQKDSLSKRTGLTYLQVSNWFTNTRKRVW